MSHARSLGRRHEATVAMIVGAITPAFPVLDDATRAAVLADVTRFVSSQVQVLPDFLRFPYKLALTGFEWLPMLRWGRPFRALDAERRVAYVEFWGDSKLAALRNFVKLIRGCALLAYYDHPALIDALETQTRRPAPVPIAAGRLS